MTSKPPDPWAEWMAAEQGRDEDRADRTLGVAMRSVVRHEPTRALSERLLATASVPRPAVAATSERLVVAGVIGGALAMTLLPVSVIALFVLTDAGRIVSLAARGCVWVTEWLNAGVSLWTVIGRTGQALGQATGSPAVSLVLTVALLAASSALLVLNRYLPVERS
jgi:hypothetical protein